jgi:hypothetical protein
LLSGASFTKTKASRHGQKVLAADLGGTRNSNAMRRITLPTLFVFFYAVMVPPGDVVVAQMGQVNGVLCTSSESLRFISVVAPRDAGYEPLPVSTNG